MKKRTGGRKAITSVTRNTAEPPRGRHGLKSCEIHGEFTTMKADKPSLRQQRER